MRTRAVLSGLVNNAQFDARLGVRRVHRLFRLALLDILGVKTLRQQSVESTSAKVPVRRSRTVRNRLICSTRTFSKRGCRTAFFRNRLELSAVDQQLSDSQR